MILPTLKIDHARFILTVDQGRRIIRLRLKPSCEGIGQDRHTLNEVAQPLLMRVKGYRAYCRCLGGQSILL